MLACFLPLSRRGVPAIAVDVLYVDGHGRESRQIADKPIDFVAEDFRRPHAHGRRSAGRIVASRERHMEKSLGGIASHMRIRERDDGVFEVGQVDHRHLFRRGVRSRVVHAEVGHDLYESIEEPPRVEPGGSLKVIPEPIFGHVQPEMRHANELMMNAVT
jgi:hypothetical protein